MVRGRRWRDSGGIGGNRIPWRPDYGNSALGGNPGKDWRGLPSVRSTVILIATAARW